MKPSLPWTPLVYQELCGLASRVMAGERSGHTLEPSALANEVWLRLQKSHNAADLEHAAFLGLAAQSMRRILNEHARRRGAAKRDAGGRRTTLSGQVAPALAQDFALDLDAALVELEEHDPELARLVELRFYGGLDTEGLATQLGISTRTVKRRWRFARAWLQQRMQEEGS